MCRNKWIVAILACFIILLPSLGSAQSAKVKTAMADLKAMTADLGTPKLQGSNLYFGNDQADQSIVEALVTKDGGAASLFVKRGDQYVRVATTLKKDDGSSAVGTTMDAKNPAMAKLN